MIGCEDETINRVSYEVEVNEGCEETLLVECVVNEIGFEEDEEVVSHC